MKVRTVNNWDAQHLGYSLTTAWSLLILSDFKMVPLTEQYDIHKLTWKKPEDREICQNLNALKQSFSPTLLVCPM